MDSGGSRCCWGLQSPLEQRELEEEEEEEKEEQRKKVGKTSAPHPQGLRYRPVRPNLRGQVPIYRTGLAGNRSKPVEVKLEFKILCANDSYRFTGRFDW